MKVRATIKRSFILFLLLILTCSMSLSAYVMFSTSVPGRLVDTNTFVLSKYKHQSYNPIKGKFGEALNDIDYIDLLRKTGWAVDSPRLAPQGLDGFVKKFDDSGKLMDVISVETKYNTSQLGSTKDGIQMSKDWNNPRIKRDIIDKVDEFIEADKAGLVEIALEKPNPASIKEYYNIDKDSFYYVDKATGKKMFYPGKESYQIFDSRINQGVRTNTSLRKYVETGSYRRREVRYIPDLENRTLTRVLYDIQDGASGSSDVVEIIDSRFTKVIKGNDVDKVLNSLDVKHYIGEKFNLPDVNVLDGLDSMDKLALLHGDVSVDAGRKIFASKANRAALSNRLGLNPKLDYSKIGMSNSEWTALVKTSSVSNLDTPLKKNLYKASSIATIKGTAKSSLGFALFYGGINTISQGIQYGWDAINWGSVAYSTGMGAAYGVADAATDALGRYLIRKGQDAATTLGKNTLKVAGRSAVIGLDILVDSYSAFSRYNSGYYVYKSQAVADGGINAAVDIIFGAMTFFPNPYIKVAGHLGLALWGFGNQFVINPITNTIEIHRIFDDLAPQLRYEKVEEWTCAYLAAQNV